MPTLIGSTATGGSTAVNNVSVPAGTDENSFLVAFVTANDAPAHTAPGGWDLIDSANPSGTTTCWVYARQAEGVPGDTGPSSYLWIWNASHQHHVIMMSFADCGGIRDIDFNTATNSDTLTMPSLSAEEDDLLLGVAHHWTGAAGSEPVFDSELTFINGSSTYAAAAYEIVEAGPTEEYEVTSTSTGRFAVGSVLLEPDDEPPPPPVTDYTFYNTFDGPVSTELTPNNSEDHGTRVSVVNGYVRYFGAAPAQGSAGLIFGDAVEAENGSIQLNVDDWDVPGNNLDVWAMRAYVRINFSTQTPAKTIFGQATGLSTTTLFNFNSSTTITFCGQSTDVPDWFRGQWVRVEFLYSSSTDTITGRMWWNYPWGTGDPDIERTITSIPTPPGFFTFGGNDGLTNNSLDALVINHGDQWIGPEWPLAIWPAPLFENTLDGPDGEPVDTVNTGSAWAAVQGTVVFSRDHRASGTGSMRVGGDTGVADTVLASFTSNAGWGVRFYAYIPEGGALAAFGRTSDGTDNLSIIDVNEADNTYIFANQDASAYADNLVGRLVRIEVMRNRPGENNITTARVWWTDPYSASEPDHEEQFSQTSWNLGQVIFVSRSTAEGPGYVDEFLVRRHSTDGTGVHGWIGPVYPQFESNITGNIAITGNVDYIPPIDDGAAHGTIGVGGHATGYKTSYGSARTEIALGLTRSGGGNQTSVTLPNGTADGTFVVVYGTANGEDVIVDSPPHWILAQTYPIGGNRRTWVWWFIANNEPDEYTVTWAGAHHHYLNLIAWSGVSEIAEIDGEVASNENSLPLPVIPNAQSHDVLLALGFHWLETAKMWEPDGLTEITNLPRAIISGYQTLTESGSTPEYTLETGPTGAMNTVAVLLRGPGAVHYSTTIEVASRTGYGHAFGAFAFFTDINAYHHVEHEAHGDIVVSGVLVGGKVFDSAAHGSFEITAHVDGTQEVLGYAESAIDVSAYSTGHGDKTDIATGEIFIGGRAQGTRATTGVAHGAFEFSGNSTGTQIRIIPDVPILGLRARLVAYEPNGERLGELPQPTSWQLGTPLNDMPSLALEYSTEAVNAHLLEEPCEVAVEFAPMNTLLYQEPPGCRFLNLRNQRDTADRTGVVRYTMPSYAWMLRKVCNINEAAFDEEGNRSFPSSTAGEILRAFYFEAQNRGNIPGLEIDFTNTLDSSGQPWEFHLSLTFDAGQPLLTVLEALAEQGIVDWRINKRTLQVYNTESSLNRDLQSEVVLHLGRDVQEAPNDETIEEIASTIFVIGDEGSYATEQNPQAITPWGEWEESLTQGGVSDPGTMGLLAQRRLAETESARTQMTRKVAFPTTKYLPLIDYLPGDSITGPGADGTNEELRVMQITISSVDPYTIDGVIVLNDRFIERELRRNKQLMRFNRGSGSGPGGGGSPPGEDRRSPSAPDGFLLDTDTFINENGEARGIIFASWLPVNTATNGTEMDIRSYQVFIRTAIAGENFVLRGTVEHPDTSISLSPFEIGQLYEVRVRSVGRNNRPGPYTETQAIVPVHDDIPPGVPSAPDVSSRLGVIRIAWDGLTEHGTEMARDFDHVRVYMHDAPTPLEAYEQVDTLYREGMSVIPNQPYDEDRFFYLTAVDRTGNESEPSEVRNIATEQLVPGDVSPGSIGYELLEEGAVRDDILADDAVRNRHVAAGEITGEKIRAYSIFADRIAVGNTRNLLTDPNLNNEDLNDKRFEISSGFTLEPYGDGKNAVALDRSVSDNGGYTFYYVQNPETENINDLHGGIATDEDLGRVIGRWNLTIVGMTAGTVNITGQAVFLDRAGNVINYASVTSAETFNEDVLDYELISSNGAQIPAEAYAYILAVRVLIAGTPESTRIWLNRPFTAMSNGQVLIEDGAISANKIMANAVTADKIEAGAIEAQHIQANAITTDQLAANAITAKHTITGATIQTTTTAFRGIRMTSTSLTAYDQNGNTRFSVSASTGNVLTTGTYQSGLSGQNRILIAPNANYLNQPGIRMYSGATGARDSSLFIDSGTGEGGWGAYAVALTGSEVARNSTGRTDLSIRHGSGGGAYLRSQFGTYSGVGFDFQQWNMWLRGRKTQGQGALDMFIYGRTGPHAANTGSVTVTYGTTAQNGGRIVQVSPYTRNTLNRFVEVVVAGQNRSQVFFGTRNATGSFRLNYLAMWVESNVSGS